MNKFYYLTFLINVFWVGSLIIFGISYFRQLDSRYKENIKTVLNGLLRAEKLFPIDDGLRVAVGFGSCMDVIAQASAVFQKLESDPPLKPEYFRHIENQEQLEKLFAYYFKYGAAAEVYTNNQSFFDYLVEKALEVPSTRKALGGNAPVMLKNFLNLGYSGLLGAQMSKELSQMMGGNIQTGEEVVKDDIHLILEYNKEESWGLYTSPRANRFIVHNDQNNPMLASLEKFQKHLSAFVPHLVVIGGLQMMDNFPFKPGQRRERLNKLASTLEKLSLKTHVHFEMAHFSDKTCLMDILQTVASNADSFGMNEQELPNLLGLLLNDSMTHVSDPVPRIASTLDQMRILFDLLKKNSFGSSSPRSITRLHVHTLAFQAIMTEIGSSWKNSMQAAAKASLTANRHTCGSDTIHPDFSRLLMDDSFALTRTEGAERLKVNPEEPVTCWREKSHEFCLAPVLVCTKVVQTVGGGDNISSSGLVVQI